MGFVINVGVFGTILGDGRKRSGGLRVYVYIAALRLRRSEPVVSDSYSAKSLDSYIYMCGMAEGGKPVYRGLGRNVVVSIYVE